MNKRGGRGKRGGFGRNWAIGVGLFLAAFAILSVAYYKPVNQPDWGSVPELEAAPAVSRPMVHAMFFGDEVSAISPGPFASKSYVRMTAANMNWSLSVNAVPGSGYVSRGGNAPESGDRSLPERADTVIKAKPDVLVIAAGRYDATASAQDVDAAVTALYGKLREGLPNTKIAVITPWAWNTDDARTRDRAAETSESIVRAAETIGATVIDQSNLHRVAPGSEDQLLGSNGAPSSNGHDIIARSLVRELLQAKLPLGPQDWHSGALTGKWVDDVAAGAESFARGAAN